MSRSRSLARLAGDLLAEDPAALSGADVFELVMELELSDAAYRAFMAATTRLSFPSLVDFLV